MSHKEIKSLASHTSNVLKNKTIKNKCFPRWRYEEIY